MRITHWIAGCVTFATLACCGFFAVGEDNPAPQDLELTLHLADGDYLTGTLEDHDQPDQIRFRSPGFDTPFIFPIERVSSVQFPRSTQRPKPTGKYCFELAGGDLVYGDLKRLSKTEAELDLERFGSVTVDRKVLRRILRWGDSDSLVYLGPNGLEGWRHSGGKKRWKDENGHLATDAPGAYLHGDFDIPAQSAIEFELSWKKKPDFVFAFGVDQDKKNIDQSFHIEVWEQDVVLMRETEDEVDVVSLMKLKNGPGRIHFQGFLDQEENRMAVYSSAGKQLADLQLTGGDSPLFTFGGVRLMNKNGDVRLERLRIGDWDGETPREVQATKSRVHHTDGTITYGSVTEFDPETKQFVVAGDDGEVRIDQQNVESLYVSPPETTEPRKLRIVFRDGSRASGSLSKIEQGRIWLNSPGVKTPLVFEFSQIYALTGLGQSKRSEPALGRVGRLEMEGVRLHGFLDKGQELDKVGALVWKPVDGVSSSPARKGSSGKIIYRNPPPPKPKRQDPRRNARARGRRPAGFWGGVINKISGADPVDQRPGTGGSGRALHLRTGDAIPCTVSKIDEKGVTLRSSVTAATFVPHEKIKALELASAYSTIRFSPSKLKRLLTLPRMQRDNPPTHLIRSIKGDYLRGRIEYMDEQRLVVEVHLESKQIRREYISRIIWLHPDELEADEDKVADENLPERTRIQTLRSDGTRLTFFPETIKDGLLMGESDVLGACRVDVKNVDQLYFGKGIEEAAAQLTYHRWKMQHAVEPRYLTAEDGDGGPRFTGLESPLVGMEAPDFELDLLDGKRFRLSNQKGRILVLDFWATWCGPCIQAMPQIDGVVSEFADHDVSLIAVNLEEAPEQIKSKLERLKLDVTVALDRHGVVADRYSATAIPQTVIIDRDGKIARVFVGGGPNLAEQFRKSLQEVVDGKADKGGEVEGGQGESRPVRSSPRAVEQLP